MPMPGNGGAVSPVLRSFAVKERHDGAEGWRGGHRCISAVTPALEHAGSSRSSNWVGKAIGALAMVGIAQEAMPPEGADIGESDHEKKKKSFRSRTHTQNCFRQDKSRRSKTGSGEALDEARESVQQQPKGGKKKKQRRKQYRRRWMQEQQSRKTSQP